MLFTKDHEEDRSATAAGLITHTITAANAIDPIAASHRNTSSFPTTAKSNTTTEKSLLATFFSMKSDHAA